MEHVFEPCDTCGHRSFVYAELHDGRELTWCGHHGATKLQRLNEIGAHVIDLRHLIGAV